MYNSLTNESECPFCFVFSLHPRQYFLSNPVKNTELAESSEKIQFKLGIANTSTTQILERYCLSVFTAEL